MHASQNVRRISQPLQGALKNKPPLTLIIRQIWHYLVTAGGFDPACLLTCWNGLLERRMLDEVVVLLTSGEMQTLVTHIFRLIFNGEMTIKTSQGKLKAFCIDGRVPVMLLKYQ